MIDAEKADAEMGKAPDTVRRNGTRVYSQPMDDGRTRVTIYRPSGAVETYKAMHMTPADEKFANMFSPFQRAPELETIVAEKKRAVESSLNPLVLGYIKRKRVRLWALAYITPRSEFIFSKNKKEPYYQGFWVESVTVSGALKEARMSVEEFPAIINLYIANTPSDKSLAMGSAPDRQHWRSLRCPEMEKIPKPEPPRATKLTFSAIAGLVLMTVLSIYWPSGLFRFSWMLSLIGIGLFFVWRKHGDSVSVGRFLNFFRPSKKVNILEDWCPDLADYK